MSPHVPEHNRAPSPKQLVALFKDLQERAEDIGMAVGLYLLPEERLPGVGKPVFLVTPTQRTEANAPLGEQLEAIEAGLLAWEEAWDAGTEAMRGDHELWPGEGD